MSGSSTMSTGRMLRLAGKELREILRDRRTVLTLVLMPLLVYPLLGVIMRKGVLSNLELNGEAEVIICFKDPNEAGAFEYEMASGRTILESQSADTEDSDTAEPGLQLLPGMKRSVTFRVMILDPEVSLRTAVDSGEVDIGIKIAPVQHPPGFQSDPRFQPRPFMKWEIIRRKGSALGDRGFAEIRKNLDAVNANYNMLLLEQNSLSATPPQQISDEVIDAGDTGPPTLITFIPLVLVLMTMTGAVYPAIDLTAGERERGTMEILVAAPVSRMNLLAGKFFAVLVVALLTATMNLISMFATLFALGLEGTVLGNIGPVIIIQVIVLMVVFAAFFSAVLLSITSIARSFKEAQAYLIPLMLISLTPGVFSLMPNVQMNTFLAVVPLVNTVLMARDLLLGDVNLLVFAVVLISTALYGVLALSLAARIFGSNAVMYGSGGSWTELFRRPKEQTARASLQVAMGCLAVVFSTFIVAGTLPGRIDATMDRRLLLSGVISILLFVGIPLATAKLARISVFSGFALNRPSLLSLCAAALLGTSLWPFIYEIEIAMLTESRIEDLKAIYESFDLNLKVVPLWLKLFSLAIAPAVCEEFFFHGFLQNAIRARSTAMLSILSTGILFGLFHVIVKDALMFERLIPSTLMGIAIGFVFERSGSVIPGMLLHVIHNGLLVSVSHYEDELMSYGIGMSEHQHLPMAGLLTAGFVVCAAFLMLALLGSASTQLATTEDPGETA